MTDLDALHAALDAEPWSATLRLVIADELDALDDPLGEGYRALGVLGLSPGDFSRERPGKWFWWLYHKGISETSVPAWWRAWHAKIDTGGWLSHLHRYGLPFRTRREADDAAAKAFTRLPAATQAAILEAAGASV